MKSDIGITDKKRKEVSLVLNIILSTESMLYVKTRKAHWNAKGNNFMELHKLFEQQYNTIETGADEIAERIAKLECPISATMKEFIKLSFIKESPGELDSGKEMLKNLFEDHEKIIREIRSYITYLGKQNHDVGTIDFLTQLMLKHETMAWVLRRYLS